MTTWIVRCGCVVAIALMAGCSTSSGGSSSRLTPAVVQQYVLTQEATENLSRVLSAIKVGDQTAQELSTMRPGSTRWENMRYGSRLSWNNVNVLLNSFTTDQYTAIPEIRRMIGAEKAIAITWENTLDGFGRQVPTRKQMHQALTHAHTAELAARGQLNAAALALSKRVCMLTKAHSELATAQDAFAACDAAKRLAPPPST
jgi:hypothetical protein